MITRERKAREAVEKELAELRLQRRIAEEVRNAVEERDRHIEFLRGVVEERQQRIEFLQATAEERDRHIEVLWDIADKKQQHIEILQATAQEWENHIEFLRAEAQDRKNLIELLYKMASGAVDARNAALKQLADERRKSAAERQQFLAIIESLTARLGDRGNVDGRAETSQ